jgi:hypothetical protein
MSSRASNYRRGLRQSMSEDNFPACESRPRRGMPSAGGVNALKFGTKRDAVFVPFVIFVSFVVILAAS